MTQENLDAAFENHTAGSQGFCEYVETHCSGLGLSREEIERICEVAPNSSAFMRVWEDSAWWTDEANA